MRSTMIASAMFALALVFAVAAAPAQAGMVVQVPSGETIYGFPSDPTIIAREERRADSGDLAGATADLALYVAAHPAERGPMVLLGDFYYRARALKQAEQTYRAALELGSAREIHNRLGGVLALEQRYDDAIAEFRASLPLPEGFVHLIALHRMLGDLDVFVAQTASVANRHPSDANYAVDLGLVYDAAGRAEDALAAYRRAVDLDPNDPVGYDGIGSVLISQEHYAEALHPLQQALSLQPAFVAALNNLGDAYLGLKDMRSARRYLELAAAIDPRDASVLVNLGVLEDLGGNRAVALDHYRRAIAVDPFQLEAYYDTAADYDAQGQHELAEAVTLKGLAIDARDGILHFNLAVIEDELGRHQNALKEYRLAAALGNPQAARLAKLALSQLERTPTSVR
ncbi:tetratricopeptide repeat protein [bacterium]|nr:MAG: tetratricopeptide repeat protein [bacterium]